jgi:Methyltransferase domain
MRPTKRHTEVGGPRSSVYCQWPSGCSSYKVQHTSLSKLSLALEVVRLGALGDGRKWVCGHSRVAKKPDCVVYSFGKNFYTR